MHRMSDVYTLPVIDEDGEITGTPGSIIAPSRGFELSTFDDVEVGEAVPWEGMPYWLSAEENEWTMPDGRMFRQWRVADVPNYQPERHEGPVQITRVWERIE